MNESAKQNEAKRYFAQPAYARLFRLAKQKYESIGRIGGKIRLSSLSVREKEALSGLLARDLYRQKSVTVSLSELNEKLRETKFSVDLLTLLSLLFNEEMKPKAVQIEEKRAIWNQYINHLQARANVKVVYNWLEQMKTGQANGYRVLKEHFEDMKNDLNPKAKGIDEICSVVDGLNRLPIFTEQSLERKIPLPVFAAQRTGDAHFFDRDRFAGRLFYYGILHVNKRQVDEDALEGGPLFERQQYENVGISLDDLSSQVLVLGIADGKEYSYALTLRMVRKMAAATPYSTLKWFNAALSTKNVFVSENPSICTMILELLSEDQEEKRVYPPIVCTSGQPSHAALELFDLFVNEGITLYYSGDLDVKGLAMASALQERYREHFQPWGMTTKSVLWWRNNRSDSKAGYGVSFSSDELSALRDMNLSWDEQLIETLLESEKPSTIPIKIFQEMLVPLLWDEYEKSFV